MASLLSGITFLENFGFYAVIFPLILVMAITYGILSKVQPFGDDKNVNIIISLIVAFMIISFAPAIKFLSLIIPYFAVFFILILFTLMLFQFMGVETDTMQAAYNHPGVFGVVLVVVIVGIFFFISESFPELSVTQQESGSSSSSSGSGAEMTITEDDGTTTVVIDGGGSSDIKKRRSLLRNTVFHPTILALLILTLVFGAAVYMIAVIERA